MPLEITNQTRVREPVLSTEYRGPCAMCGNDLRKLSHYGPWIPERLHQKCWKAQQNAVDPILRSQFEDFMAHLDRQAIADTSYNPPMPPQ